MRLAAAALGAQPGQLGDGPGDGLPGGRIRQGGRRTAPPGRAPAVAPLLPRATAEAGAARGGRAEREGAGGPGSGEGALPASSASSSVSGRRTGLRAASCAGERGRWRPGRRR